MPASAVGVHRLGTAIKILSIINEATATTAKITIKNPLDSTVVDNADMTKVVDKVYQYIWQSTSYASGGSEGVYKAIVSITVGSYTGVQEVHFTMERTT